MTHMAVNAAVLIAEHATHPLCHMSMSLSMLLPLSLCKLLTYSIPCMLPPHSSQLLCLGARLARDECLNTLLQATYVKLLHLRCEPVPDSQFESAVGVLVQALAVARMSTEMIRVHQQFMQILFIQLTWSLRAYPPTVLRMIVLHI